MLYEILTYHLYLCPLCGPSATIQFQPTVTWLLVVSASALAFGEARSVQLLGRVWLFVTP